MNLTDLANARSGFSAEMSNLLTLIAGAHTPEQRSAQIGLTTTQCFQLCKTAKAVRVANPNSINTEDFYARPDLPLCELMDSYHLNLGGTRMYEMFCTGPETFPGQHPECIVPPPRPTFPEGPLVLQYQAKPDALTFITGFQGTIEYQDGTIVNYDSPTNLVYMDLPDDGDGYCTIMLRGTMQDAWTRGSYAVRDLVSVWQWGTECTISNYYAFFYGSQLPCFAVRATDSPWFGSHPHGEYGTDISVMFGNCIKFNSPLNHWNMHQVTKAVHMFHFCHMFNQPLDLWDTSTITDMSYMFAPADIFNQDISMWDVDQVTKYNSFADGADALEPQHMPNFI